MHVLRPHLHALALRVDVKPHQDAAGHLFPADSDVHGTA